MTQMQGRQWYLPRSSITANTITNTTTQSFSTSTSCCGLTRLLRKLKRSSNKMLKTSSTTYSTSRQSSFQCRYDPLSYALNFDTSDHVTDDEDYYKFCAFSSRFVATTKPHDYHSQTLIN
ncbi:hypothetical protein AABB24_023964 [Solanum stoloniferum]|uniref:Uncharacterized protein n=1 Tax=Solanum stoloniferum TaxID=62892 RepID=A0ABD2SLQ0_9SOLN